MALKKKKKVKKAAKKVKAEGDDDDENKCPIEFPEYQDPDIITPRAKLTIRLATPIIQKLSK